MAQVHSGFEALTPITLGTGAKVKLTCRLPMEDFRKGVASPTATIRNGVAGFLFDADAEELFIQFCVPLDWDQASDINIAIFCVLNADEDINDKIDWESSVVSIAEHEDVDTAGTQTPGVEHDIETYNAAGMLHKVTIILDYDHALCPLAVEDNISCRLSRTANVGAAGYVAGVIVLDICIEYQKDRLGGVI